MTTTENYGLNLPEENDFVDVNKINENTEKIDQALKDLDDSKASASGGDISDTVITSAEEPAAEYPVPAAGDSTKVFLGKTRKFFSDIKNWMTGVCMLGQIVNNCVTDNAKLPLSAAQGKALMDLYNVLNTKRQEIAVFKTSVSKNITAGSWGFWHEKITIPSGYKILYVSATFDNADKCMLTPYSSSVVVVGTSKDIEPYFGFCAQSTGTGTFTVYAVCIKSD